MTPRESRPTAPETCRNGAELPQDPPAKHRRGEEREAPGLEPACWQNSQPQVCFFNLAFSFFSAE